MKTLDCLKMFDKKKLEDFPKIKYTNLYKRVSDNFFFEFEIERKNHLYSPLYTKIMGGAHREIDGFVKNNELFLNSLKNFILNSLYIYSALIEENSYYLTNPQSVFISRLIYKRDARFEVKFYSHYKEELESFYKDKIYIGRDFLNLYKFDRKFLGLKKYYLSLEEQNLKIQERAKNKLRYYDDYNTPYLKEIDYLTREIIKESMERIHLFPEVSLEQIRWNNLPTVLDSIHYLLNLMIEIRDFTQEFENKLRIREEYDFVKYMTKFSKDLIDGIRYLRKLTCHLHLKISGYKI